MSERLETACCKFSHTADLAISPKTCRCTIACRTGWTSNGLACRGQQFSSSTPSTRDMGTIFVISLSPPPWTPVSVFLHGIHHAAAPFSFHVVLVTTLHDPSTLRFHHLPDDVEGKGQVWMICNYSKGLHMANIATMKGWKDGCISAGGLPVYELIPAAIPTWVGKLQWHFKIAPPTRDICKPFFRAR